MMKFRALIFLALAVTTGLWAADLDYPASYREMGLPEYTKANVSALGRDNSSVHDGISITLLTDENDATLRVYYETEMKARGWLLEETIASKKMRAAGMLDQMPFGAIFSKDGMRYQLFTGQQTDGKTIHISVISE
jgi:hypothetical protein